VGSIALGATPDALVLALGADLDAPVDGQPHARLVVLTPDGAELVDEAVDARGAPFVVQDGSLHVVWPGAADEAVLASLARAFGETRVVHEAASLYFTQPYAALPMRFGDGASHYILLHYDAVSCLVGGVSATASVPGQDGAQRFVVPGALHPSLALAPLGDGFVAVYTPGDAGAASAWQRLDRTLAPVGEAHGVSAVGCGLATAIEGGAVAACDDEAWVIDARTDTASAARYPTPGAALAMAPFDREALVVVRVAHGLEVVRLPSGTRVDAFETTLAGTMLDPSPRAAVAAIDARRFVIAWLEEDTRGAARVRLRRYDVAPR
jgi:hypothetical protein